MRRRILALLCFAVLGSAFAVGEDVRTDSRDSRQDRRDFRHDRLDRRQDRRDIYRDRRDLHADRRDLRRDYRNGNYRDARRDRRDIRSDKHDLRGDRRDFRHDRHDIRHDRKNRHSDRRCLQRLARATMTSCDLLDRRRPQKTQQATSLQRSISDIQRCRPRPELKCTRVVRTSAFHGWLRRPLLLSS